MNLRTCHRVALIAMAVLNAPSLLRAADPTTNQGPSFVAHSPTSVQFGNALRLTELGKLEEAERAVETGLNAEPMSLQWHLLKADLLARQDRPLELRQALEASYAVAPENVEVLTRLAHCRDLYGHDAASIYAALAQRLEAQRAPKTQVIPVLERALLTALRDGDSELAAGVEEKLDALGQSQARKQRTDTRLQPSTLRIPGGIRALASVAGMPTAGSPQAFVTHYADRIARLVQGLNKSATKQTLEEFRDYFRTLAALEAAAGSTGDSFELSLDLKEEQTEKILQLLGWRLKQRGRQVLLELGDHPRDARRQVILSALEIDQAAMKSQLESGRPFLLTLQSERAAVAPDETFWLKQVLNKQPTSGQLLEAFLDHPHLARLYAALGNLTEETRCQVLLAADAKALLNRYSDLLYAHAEALLVEGGELVVPGGTPAQPFWEDLAGASPREPARFIASLLQKDDGKLLAYYHLIARLRVPNQRFLTRSATRLKTFLKAFPFTERQTLKVHSFARHDVQFEEMLRQLPLDAQGHIDFPGGPDVWRVSRAAANGSRPVGSLRQPSSGAEEDEILLPLLAARHNRNTQQSPLVEAFLGLVRLQRHRHQPMDEPLVALLLQKHSQYQHLFPYLASLPELTISEIALLFEAAKHLEGLDSSQLNLAVGEFHSLIQWLIVLSGNNALRDGDAARLFAELCRGFLHANTDAELAAHSCEMVLKIASALQKPSIHHGGGVLIGSNGDDRSTRGTDLALPDVEDILFRSVAGVPQEREFAYCNRQVRVNYPAWRKQQMQELLGLQSISSLNALLAIYQSINALIRGNQPAREAVEQIGTLLSELREPDPAGWQRLSETQRKTLVATQKRDLMECLIKIQKLLEKGSHDLQSLATEFTGLLNPHVQVTLLGWTYAFYFSPRDLILASDPWFVRRHQFFEASSGKETVWAPTQVRSYVSGSGSYLSGGLAQIAATAGEVGLVGRDAGGSVGSDTASSKMAAMQLASLRSIPWAAVDEHGPRQLALKSLFGRELLAEAIRNPKVQAELSEPLLHLIGLRRRAEVFQALANGDLAGTFRLLSISDLYFLADSQWRRDGVARWTDTPLSNALEQEAKRQCSRQVSWFGGYQASDGCVRSHLVDLGPYEEHEGFWRQNRMAERLSAIGLDLAVGAYRLGLPVDVLALLAETAVHHTARRALMKDRDDWEAALQALRSLRLETFLEHLEKMP
jgi:hypothetical protein